MSEGFYPEPPAPAEPPGCTVCGRRVPWGAECQVVDPATGRVERGLCVDCFRALSGAFEDLARLATT